jgi:nucleoside 2-deoxyribosyltransferase
MLCCKYGVAVLEDIIADEFNPNVALEYGFMRALGKPTLLLKERRFKPRADILGTVWNEFDVLDVRQSVPKALGKWLHDIGHHPPPLRDAIDA